MNKFRSLLLLFACLTSMKFSLNAQSDTTTTFVKKVGSNFKIDEARRDYANGNKREALVGFREAFNNDPNSAKAAYWIGRCQYDLSNYGYAIKYARIALNLKKGSDPEINFLIAQSYHRSDMLDSAITQYKLSLEDFSKARADELSVKQYLSEAERAKELSANPIINTRNLYKGDVNTGFDDYAPILTENGKRIYFASRRSNTTGGGVNPDDQVFFEDIYTGEWNASKLQWDSISNNIPRLNSNGFEAISHFTTDGQEVYLTVNNTLVPKQKKPTLSSDIYHAKLSAKGTWSSPKAVKGVNSTFFDAAATLTADGLTMYFTSERKGTKGKADIWVSHLNGNNWSKPDNLGSVINTSGQETTPYISPDGKYLYFSSNNRDGIGGYDVYVAEFDGMNWSKPVNLGLGINSVNDDTHFIYYPELKLAVMSSIRLIEDKASYDIFYIDMANFTMPKFEY